MSIQEAVVSEFSISSNKIVVAGDGGTIGFELMDLEGQTHQLFIDRRIGTETRDHLYANHYPADSRSIYLGLNESILFELNKLMN